ncbi:hypothetical protein GYMLUDRAFT_50885 [Collybiopsis luxurians FD-317 M1]|uniref:Uncharacterized protein n=1 Tax=Collybiopsis luxurians FD-317 M1 TaxID=944289 RepID=A0A0D0C8A4_9AGAR|nr:hypothetical protein GYMLUDRAFT_50885 [Collybiopsis luxurians FD-317 M1]
MHPFWTEFDYSTRAFQLGFAESYYWLCNSCSSGSTSESSPTITSHQYINLPNSCITHSAWAPRVLSLIANRKRSRSYN